MEEKKVEYIELFYDLIFVYCISRLTVLLEPMTEHFQDFSVLPIYLCCFFCVLQCWIFTALLMNRYGYRQISDYICIFINMFLLYLMADGISADIEYGFVRFHIAWALVFVNLAVQFAYRKYRHDCLDAVDDRIINRYLIILLGEGVLALACAAAYAAWGLMLTPVAFGYGFVLSMAFNKVYALRPLHFDHFTERIALLIVITFGEMIVGITPYFERGDSLFYAIFVFLIVIGLFLLYIFNFYNLQDHAKIDNGVTYMVIHVPIIFSLNNITAGLTAMPNPESPLMEKTVYLLGAMALFLIFHALLAGYRKPEFTQKSARTMWYHLGTAAAFGVFIALVAATDFNPRISLILTVAFVYFALLLMYIYYRKNRIETRINDFCEIRW